MPATFADSRVRRFLDSLSRWFPSRLAAILGPRQINPGINVRAWYDVVGRPVALHVGPDGREIAIDYSHAPRCAEVPIEWVRAMGDVIDPPRAFGLILSQQFRDRAPLVGMGADSTTVYVVTPKTTVTRVDGEWKQGYHLPLGMAFHPIREGAKAIIAESQAALAHPKARTTGKL